MSEVTLITIGIASYLLIGITIFGVIHELDIHADNDPGMTAFLCMFWAPVIGMLAIMGVGWCLAWLGRGPVRLVRHLMQVERIPRAVIVDKEHRGDYGV